MKKSLLLLSVSVFLLVGCKKNEPVVLPTVNTGSYSINAGVVTCGGEVTNAGNGVISDRGICYMAGSSSPSISNSLIRAGNGTGDFTCDISGLAEGNYSYCAYATNEAGTAYGQTKMFTIEKATPKYKIVDLIGNYTCEAEVKGVTIYWTASISTYTAFDNLTWVAIQSLNYYNAKDVAVGVVDENQQCIKILSGYTTNTDDVSYWDSEFSAYCYDIFYPIYISSSGDYRLVTDGSSVDSDRGEAWLRFSQNDKSQLTLTFGPSNNPDQWGIKANAYLFNIYYQSSGDFTNYYYGPVTKLKMYKSNSMVAPQSDSNVPLDVVKNVSHFSNEEIKKMSKIFQIYK